jgi:RNA polymerase sigma factor (TIGR02999 family)
VTAGKRRVDAPQKQRIESVITASVPDCSKASFLGTPKSVPTNVSRFWVILRDIRENRWVYGNQYSFLVKLIDMSDVTRILSAIERGDQQAADQLLPLVYEELRKLASAKMAQESPGHTLQSTALVHEAYLRLVDTNEAQHWDSRGHFFASAAEAMRRIMIESVRRKASVKHGGERQRLVLNETDAIASVPDENLLKLDDAITELEKVEPQKAELVKLRYFAGLEETEAASMLGISRATASRWWAFSKAWLFERMKKEA